MPASVAGAAVLVAPEPDLVEVVETPALVPEEVVTTGGVGESLPFVEAQDSALPGSNSAPAEDLPLDPGLQDGRSPLFSIIIGVLCGGVIGVVASMLLLVFSLPDRALGRMTDPVELWLSIGDPLVKTSAMLIAAGFVLLGLGLASWSRRKA